MANPNPVCRFTPESARIAALNSAEVRRQRKAEPEPIAPDAQFNVLATEFTDAVKDTLGMLRETTDWKARAALARAIRDLRETYHLVTGQPRPGLAKGKPSVRRPVQSSPDAPQS